MAREMNTMDEFLGHRGTERSGNFLGNWKKDKRVNVFLHRRQLPVALYRHGVPKVFVQDGEDGAVRRVFGGQYNCHEDEGVLKRQYHRHDDGSRKHPPRACGVCRLIETVRDMVDEGQLKWTDPLFRFVADDPRETQVIHAGGLCNLFGGDLQDGEKRELREAGISLREAWKENWYAKLSYVMVVVVPEHADEGVQIAVETGLLGDKVKEVIGDAMVEAEAAGNPNLGDPTKNPYCIQWEHRDEDGLEFSKRYKARRMGSIKPSDEVLKLISGEKPDLSGVTAPHDQKTMRAVLERHCLVKSIPWDHVYSFEPPAPRSELAKEHPDMAGVVDKPAADPFDDLVECDKCGKAMRPDLDTCPTCGTKYDVATGKVLEKAPPPPKQPEPPPPQGRRMRRRSQGGSGPSNDKAPY